MIKAVFIDYTGTTVYQTGFEMDEIVRLVKENSTMNSEKEILKYFYTTRVEKEKECYLDTYLSEDEIIDLQLKDLTENHGLTIQHHVLKDLVHQFWNHTPVYEDAKEFYDLCPLPIYVLTNNGAEFVSNTMKSQGLNPAGTISSDDVKAYKPKLEIFQKALEIAGVSNEEVIHIGDSYSSDVLGALNAKIYPIWINRDQQAPIDELTTVHHLCEVLPLLMKK